jgi:hypothetical protein
MKLKISLSVIIITTAYFLLFGKLFPFSPIAVGFEKYELRNVIVYVQHGSSFNNFKIIDSYTKSVESFHHLAFKMKPKIYIFSQKDTYLSQTVTKARFYAYPNGSLMVSPWAVKESEDGVISMEIYIKHELSHILLYQNMGVTAAYHFPQWFMEGIAMYSTGQMGTSWYPDKKQTYDIIKKGNYFPPFLYKTEKEDNVKLDIDNRIAFMYSEFACIVDFIINKYGEDRFYQYVKGLLANKDHDTLFNNVFHTDFHVFLNEFTVNAGK